MPNQNPLTMSKQSEGKEIPYPTADINQADIFSPRKAATVLYGVMGFSESEALLAKLGKHTTGGGCLYIKKLADVDQNVSETLVLKSVVAKKER